jgi:hypothetical protein
MNAFDLESTTQRSKGTRAPCEREFRRLPFRRGLNPQLRWNIKALCPLPPAFFKLNDFKTSLCHYQKTS